MGIDMMTSIVLIIGLVIGYIIGNVHYIKFRVKTFSYSTTDNWVYFMYNIESIDKARNDELAIYINKFLDFICKGIMDNTHYFKDSKNSNNIDCFDTVRKTNRFIFIKYRNNKKNMTVLTLYKNNDKTVVKLGYQVEWEIPYSFDKVINKIEEKLK